MITEQQKELSDYIKNVHMSLRRRAQEVGAETAWREHLGNEQILKQYAKNMKELSEKFWSVNNKADEKNLLCRNDWIAGYILNYFQNKGFQKEMEKEAKKLKIYVQKKLIDSKVVEKYNFVQIEQVLAAPYTLLDVGSCFNPLKKFNFLDVYPLDLSPAIPEVKKCNFINVKIEKIKNKNWFNVDEINEIPSEYFDVVVFSLYLEYLPSSLQRFLSCEKAYKCLKGNGLLLIITPDSKHETANAHTMKNWKIAAASIGFNRTKLEKLKYLYCMAFRKAVCPKYPLVLNKVNIEKKAAKQMFTIPQDFVDYREEKKCLRETTKDLNEVKETFTELPFA